MGLQNAFAAEKIAGLYLRLDLLWVAD